MTAVSLTYGDLVIAFGLILLNAGLSLLLSLGIARRMLVGGLRAAVQLTLVGLVLTWVFTSASPWIVLSTVLVMLAAATHEIASRQEVGLGWHWSYGIGSGTLLIATSVVTLLALTTHLRPVPWYDPRYVVPLVGILLGSVMSGVSLGLTTMTSGAMRERAAIEAQLALGADRFKALRPLIVRSLRGALIPITNQMAAAGVVTLPGTMTGQILAGMDPAEAVKYQILILFLLAGATGLASLATVYLAAWRLTDERDRLRLDRLRPARGQ